MRIKKSEKTSISFQVSGEMERIAKPEFDLKGGYSGSAVLNTSTGNNRSNSSPQYFKSSFARSLSTLGSQSRSLDFSINGYPQEFSPLSMPLCSETRTERSTESLISTSSVATIVRKSVWTGNAQVCCLRIINVKLPLPV